MLLNECFSSEASRNLKSSPFPISLSLPRNTRTEYGRRERELILETKICEDTSCTATAYLDDSYTNSKERIQGELQ